MVKLNPGNVLLKPSHRRQLMAWLKRAQRLGTQVGDFFMTISLHRTGHVTEVRAEVHHAAGNFICRARRSDWRDAMRETAAMLSNRLHDQLIGLAAV
jgi:hypothetical protein